jgi:LuxR family maltose regulon positive regulatory protein
MTSLPVTRTKVLLPGRPPSLLTRPRLIDLLEGSLDRRLILITAPAGYGKTSLLVDLAHQAELPICWYALDPLDQDLQRFAAHLIASIAQRFPGFGSRSAAAVQDIRTGDPDLDRLVRTIVNEVYDLIREHFIMVLDDYHLVRDSSVVNRFVSQFIQRVDENCHLILSSRTLLPLPDLPLMVARSQVGGLDFEELAFRPHEVQALVLQNHHLTMPQGEAEELARHTEGWITGLLLSTQTLYQGMADRARVARASGVGLYDYLAQQVLDQQPVRLQDFLLRTSLLEEFDSELCEAILGPGEDWQELVQAVLRRNLFVLPVENGGLWLRYHHLFQGFLQVQLAQRHPAEPERILRRMAAVFTQEEQWEKAHEALQRLGDPAATADLIEQAGPSMMVGGRLLLLGRWLEALPAEALASRPGLISVRGDVAVMLGQVADGLTWLNQAETALRGAHEGPRLARTLVRRSVAHRFLGHYREALHDADEALALTESGESAGPVRAGAMRARGLGLFHLGQLDQAADWLERSLAAYTALGDEQNRALLLGELGLVHMNRGRCAVAMEHYQRALTYWGRTSNPLRQTTVLNNLGVLYHLKGEYDQAVSYLDEALHCARESGYPHMAAVALAGIGDLYRDLDAPESARDAYRQAQEIAQKADDRFMLRYLALVRADLARLDGDLPQAGHQLEAVAPQIEESGSSYEKGMWQFEMGRLALARGDAPQATRRLEEASRYLDDGGGRAESARVHLYLALACQTAARPQCARTHLELALELRASLESEHTLVVAGRDARGLLEAWRRDPTVGRRVSGLLRQVAQFERDLPALRRRLRWGTSAVVSPPPRLTIQALGRSQVLAGGDPIADPEWQSRKIVRDLFFLLLAHADGLTKEEVGAIFWPDSSPAQLRLRFKNTIYRLRRALGQDVVLFDADLYRFDRSLDYEYDVVLFRAKLRQAQVASDPAERQAAYWEAVNLYQGPYLPEAEGTWVLPEREALHWAYRQALTSVAEHHLLSGEFRESLDCCRRLLTDDRCAEDAHRLAMRAHAAGGNRAAVVRQYQCCRQALLEEIGAPPSPQTEELYRTLTR